MCAEVKTCAVHGCCSLLGLAKTGLWPLARARCAKVCRARMSGATGGLIWQKLGQVIILQSHSSVIDREHLVQRIQLSHAKQDLSIWADGGCGVVSGQVSSIRQFARMRFDSALSLWCGRMGLGCCSCGLAPLQVLLVPAAGLTHQGMRQDTAGRKRQAGNETA